MLQLCISQEISNKSYTFKATGIRVYSIEEALYHAYHYWRESADEFMTGNLATWVAGLGHTGLAAKIKDVTALKSASKRLLAFLGIIEYFSSAELAAIKTDLERWEHRVEWEKLKDRADNLVARGEPVKAIPLYRQALSYEENANILNNLAVAHMQLSNYGPAVNLLAKAKAAKPDNITIMLHYAQAAILNGDYDDASMEIRRAQSVTQNKDAVHSSSISTSNNADILYLQGLMAYQQEDYPVALDYFQKAYTQNPEVTHYLNKIADTYLQMRQYDKALAAAKDIPGTAQHIKLAEIYADYGHSHIPEAIRRIKEAIEKGGSNEAALWIKLAQYYREDYDNERANEAIAHALPSKSVAAMLESARIKKSLGRMREYRAGLSEVLKGLKGQYRGM